MTEAKAEYRFGRKAKPPGVEWQRCPECLTVYGFEEREGEYLRVGKLRVKCVDAVCGDCGFAIHWGNKEDYRRCKSTI